MRPRVIGATLTILGVLSVLFAPVKVDYSVRVGLSYRSYSFWQLIHWPPGWSWAFLPMLIIGVTLVLTGIVLMGGVRELRRRVIGATLTLVGVLAVVFAPLHLDAVSESSGPFASYGTWDLIHWPPGWYWVHLPMLIIGFVLVVTGIILMSMRPEPARWRGDLRGRNLATWRTI